MEKIDKIIKKKSMSVETICPHCKNEARRVLREGRYFISCSFCGAETIAKTISAWQTELNNIYD